MHGNDNEPDMKLTLIIALLFLSPFGIVLNKNSEQSFDKTAYYAVLRVGKMDDVNQELDKLNTTTITEKEAYTGTLLMRKAGLVKLPSEKLKLFKKGRIALETELQKDSDNGEYHFLRLIIQEHAPKIVKYKKEIEADKQTIIKSYKHLSPAVQQAILDYSKNSKILQPQDF